MISIRKFITLLIHSPSRTTCLDVNKSQKHDYTNMASLEEHYDVHFKNTCNNSVYTYLPMQWHSKICMVIFINFRIDITSGFCICVWSNPVHDTQGQMFWERGSREDFPVLRKGPKTVTLFAFLPLNLVCILLDPVTLFLGLYPKEIIREVCKELHLRSFTPELFTTMKNWKQS